MFTFKRLLIGSSVVLFLAIASTAPSSEELQKAKIEREKMERELDYQARKVHNANKKIITKYFKKDFEDILVVLKFMDSQAFNKYSDTLHNDVAYIFDGVLEKRDTYLMLEDYKQEQLGAIKAMNSLLSDVYTLANINRHLLESGETSQEYFKNENRIESYKKALKGVNEYVSIKNPLIK